MWDNNIPTSDTSEILTPDNKALLLQGVGEGKRNEFLSYDEVDSLLRGVTGDVGFTAKPLHSFVIGQEAFIIVEAHQSKGISPMVSVQKVQIEYIVDNFIVPAYNGWGKILGVYHTSEEANRELASKVGKLIEQVKGILSYLLEVQESAVQASGENQTNPIL